MIKLITGIVWIMGGIVYTFKCFDSGEYIWASIACIYIGFGWSYIERSVE